MVKVLLSMDSELLAKVDEAARKQRISRSAFISELAAREVGSRDPATQERMDAAIEELRELARKYGTGEGSITDQIRTERDTR